MKTSTLLKSAVLATAVCTLAACTEKTPETGWKLVWEENFNGPQIDENTWTRIPKGGSDWDDMMSLREDLVFIENGELVLMGKVGGETDSTPFVMMCTPKVRQNFKGLCLVKHIHLKKS